MVIEFIVLFLSDFGFLTSPQGRGSVNRFFLGAVFEHDRQSNMVGIGVDDPAQSRRFEIFVLASRRCTTIIAPRATSGSGSIVNSPLPSDTHRQPWLSPAFLLFTSTLSATINAE